MVTRRVRLPQTISELPPEALGSVTVAVIVGLAAMGAVIFGVPTATSIVGERVPVAANTGLGFVLLATALVAAHRPVPVLRILGPIAAGAVLVLATLTIWQFVSGRDMEVDRWIFPAPPGASEMSPQTALAFLLLGAAVLLARTRAGPGAVRIAGALVILLASINVLDALFGATSPTILGGFTQMALPTAIGFGGLAIGVTALHPRGTLLEQLRLPGPTGVLTRGLLVAALAIPITVGWLRLAGERAGWYDSAYGVAITTLSTIVLFLVAVRLTGRRIEAAEQERRFAEDERQRVQAELADAQGEIADLWDRAPIGYHSLDAEGRFVHVNRTELEMLGYEREEVVGRPFADLLTPESLATFAVTFPRFKAEGEIRDVELELRRRDGGVLPVMISSTAVRDSQGRFVASRSAVQDISDQRAAEAARELARQEAEAASAAKSQFLSRMSHELRTPLNSVLGFAQLLEADSLSAEQRESVTYIRRAGRHLLDLINEVLDISRIEQGRLTISVEPVALRETLEEVAAFVQPMAASRGITLDMASVAGCDAVVLADRQRLRQVLLNLLTNAVKYNREHGSVTLGCEPMGEGRVRVSVIDTGPGIPVQSRNRLFQPFDRLGAEATDVEGSGMGLALSKALMSAMSGEIGFESEVGAGSAFWISLPRGAALPQTAFDPVQTETATDSGDATTLLYIEDNPANLRLVERVVAGMPRIRLMTAIQGRIGIELARQHRPGLVLLDIHLPDLDGREVMTELCADPATREIPVVVLSADASDHQRRALLELGAHEYLTKPIDVGELVAAIERALLSTSSQASHAG